MNWVRVVLGLLAGGIWLIGATLGVARRAELSPQVVVTTYAGTQQSVYMVDVTNGDVTQIKALDLPDARLITFSPDGKWLFYGAGGSVYRTSLWGSQRRTIQFPEPSIQADWYGYQQWSGDGRWLVIQTTDLDIANDWPDQALYRINRQTLRAERLTHHAIDHPHHVETFFHAAPDQSAVVYYGRHEEGVDLYYADIATGQETRLTTMADYEYPDGWSEDGQWLIYWSPSFPTLFRVRRDGTGDQQLLVDSNFEWLAHELVDGWVYIGSYRDSQDGGELYRVRWDGTDLQRLTKLDGYETLITLTPDGRWLYFVGGPDSAKKLYRMQPDGSQLQVVAEGVDLGREVGRSTDGLMLYFVDGSYSQTTTLSRVAIETAAIQPLGEVYSVPIRMSPDKRWLAYKRVGDEKHGITVMKAATGREKLLKLPFTRFELFGWLPLAERDWNRDGLLLGGAGMLLGGVVMGRLRKRQ